MSKCEKCGTENDGSYGSGRFCGRACANSRSLDHKKIYSETKTIKCSKCKIKFEGHKALHVGAMCESCKDEQHSYKCAKCGVDFNTRYVFREGRLIRCDSCKRVVIHHSDYMSLESLLQLSKRTITKILNRANVGCSICGWSKSTCDIHHIIPRKDNGSNDHDNLIVVCPNCHREIHSNKEYDYEFLKERSLLKTLSNWRDFYNVK